MTNKRILNISMMNIGDRMKSVLKIVTTLSVLLAPPFLFASELQCGFYREVGKRLILDETMDDKAQGWGAAPGTLEIEECPKDIIAGDIHHKISGIDVASLIKVNEFGCHYINHLSYEKRYRMICVKH